MVKERDIMHEAGEYWVLRTKDAYHVMMPKGCGSMTESAYAKTDDGLSIAKARADYLHKRNDHE